jgi:hypothetical protein
MKDVVMNPSLVAYCGLYCGACRSYRKGRCPGCHDNVKATWCKIRACCNEHRFPSCADCVEHQDPNACRQFNNWIAKLIGLLLNSNRQAGIVRIRAVGIESFAREMAEQKRQSLPRRT